MKPVNWQTSTIALILVLVPKLSLIWSKGHQYQTKKTYLNYRTSERVLGPYQWFTTPKRCKYNACLLTMFRVVLIPTEANSQKVYRYRCAFLQHGKKIKCISFRYTVLLTRRLFLGERNVWSEPVLPYYRFPLETKTHWVLHRTCRQPKGIHNTFIKNPHSLFDS